VHSDGPPEVRRPQLGWLTLEEPDAAGGGGARRQHHLIQALRRTFDVHVVLASEPELGLTLRQRVRTRIRGRSAAPLFRSSAFSRRARAELTRQDIDVVVVAHIETAAVLADLLIVDDVRTVLDLHNVYSPFSTALGEHTAARSWRRLEAVACRAATALTVLSDEDRAVVLPHNEHLTVVPNGVDMEEWLHAGSGDASSGLAYFGSWGHRPNQLGLDWFLEGVWPRLRAELPETVLHLYGPGSPQVGDAEGVRVHGRADRLDVALASHRAVIVPIAEGVGTRVKFIEALATGIPVVSTTLGAQGYDTPGDLFLRADTPADFATACVRALRREPDVLEMGRRAREHVGSESTWDHVARPLAALLSSLARPGSPPTAETGDRTP
jgi:glycosyltransferase involved in cell wall biosynthesis